MPTYGNRAGVDSGVHVGLCGSGEVRAYVYCAAHYHGV